MIRFEPLACILVALLLATAAAYAGPYAPDVKLQEDPVPSKAQVEKLMHSPNSYKAHYAAGRLYENQGLYDQAREHYEKALKCPGLEPAAYIRLSQTLLFLRDYGEAIKVITEASKRYPNDYAVQLAAGYVLQVSDKDAPAYVFYKRALSIKPKEAQTYIALADVCIELDHKEKALEYVNQGLALEQSSMMHYERARVLCWLDRKQEAEADLAANYKNDPLNSGTLSLYSDVLLSKGISEKALEVYLCMVSGLDLRETAKAKYQIGLMLRSLTPKNIADAEQEALKRIKDPRKQATVHDVLGDVYLRLSRLADAEKEYRQAVKLDAGSPIIELHLAEFENSAGNAAAAREHLSRAQKLDDKANREITMRIKELAKRLK